MKNTLDKYEQKNLTKKLIQCYSKVYESQPKNQKPNLKRVSSKRIISTDFIFAKRINGMCGDIT